MDSKDRSLELERWYVLINGLNVFSSKADGGSAAIQVGLHENAETSAGLYVSFFIYLFRSLQSPYGSPHVICTKLSLGCFPVLNLT